MKTLVALLFTTTVAFADAPPIIIQGDMDTPQTVITSEGTYIVIPDYSTGKPMAVITATEKETKE